MKKSLSLLSGVAFVCSMAMFYGISVPSAEAVVRFTVAGGSVGGSWSVFTEGAVEAMRRGNKDYQISAEPGSTTANPGMVDQGKVEMGVAFGLTALQAYQGKAN